MRGKVPVFPALHHWRGITPAHAGKSMLLPMQTVTGKDHPRPCGEKEKKINTPLMNAGSPPPMRGKGICSLLGLFWYRITPAHAGKS